MQKAKGISKATIRVQGSHVIVDHFVLDDDDVANYFGDVLEQQVEERFAQALRVGTQALRTMQTYQNVDLVERRFQSLDNKFKQRLQDTLQEFNTQFEGKFGKEGEVAKFVKEHFGEKGKVEEMFDPQNEGSVTHSLLEEFREALGDLRNQIIKESASADALNQTPVKGAMFEEWCGDVLGDIAKRQQPADILEPTGTKAASFTSKKGDFVITLGQDAGRRIAVEAKDVKKINMGEIRNYISEAIRVRGAQYAILVVKNVEALPRTVGYFNEFENRFLVCALGSQAADGMLHAEILDISYKWAKMRVLINAMKDLNFDTNRVIGKIDSMKGRMNEFASILNECHAMKEVVEEVEHKLEVLRDGFTQDLGDLVSEVNKSAA